MDDLVLWTWDSNTSLNPSVYTEKVLLFKQLLIKAQASILTIWKFWGILVFLILWWLKDMNGILHSNLFIYIIS